MASLLKNLSPRHLLAWDAILLPGQEDLILIINTVHDTYPLLLSDGALVNRKPPRLSVGLTGPAASETIQEFYYSSILEDFLNGHFWDLLKLRIKYRLSWPGAELLYCSYGRYASSLSVTALLQEVRNRNAGRTVHLLLASQRITLAEGEERRVLNPYKLSYDLSHAPISEAGLNLPLNVFQYLLRRLIVRVRTSSRNDADQLLGHGRSSAYLSSTVSCATERFKSMTSDGRTPAASTYVYAGCTTPRRDPHLRSGYALVKDLFQLICPFFQVCDPLEPGDSGSPHLLCLPRSKGSTSQYTTYWVWYARPVSNIGKQISQLRHALVFRGVLMTMCPFAAHAHSHISR